jgi:pimeloyl-ACP methyl ester carboxylesterase
MTTLANSFRRIYILIQRLKFQWMIPGPLVCFGARHQEFIEILQQLSNLFETHSPLQFIQELEPSARRQIAALWLHFIQLQNQHSYSLKAFKFMLKQPRLQKLLLPSSRIDYMRWYIYNYLYHREDYREALAGLSCPVTLFSGAQSRLYPVEGQRLVAQSLPQTRQVIFTKSGHSPLLSEPLKFTRELGIF